MISEEVVVLSVPRCVVVRPRTEVDDAFSVVWILVVGGLVGALLIVGGFVCLSDVVLWLGEAVTGASVSTLTVECPVVRSEVSCCFSVVVGASVVVFVVTFSVVPSGLEGFVCLSVTDAVVDGLSVLAFCVVVAASVDVGSLDVMGPSVLAFVVVFASVTGSGVVVGASVAVIGSSVMVGASVSASVVVSSGACVVLDDSVVLGASVLA